MIAILAFAIDRIVTGLLFLLSFTNFVSAPTASAGAGEAPGPREKRYKLLYFVFAGILGVPVIAYYGDVRILDALGMGGEDKWLLDVVVTGIALVGGAERISALMEKYGKAPAAEKEQPKPIEITGRLVLDDKPGSKTVTQ